MKMKNVQCSLELAGGHQVLLLDHGLLVVAGLQEASGHSGKWIR